MFDDRGFVRADFGNFLLVGNGTVSPSNKWTIYRTKDIWDKRVCLSPSAQSYAALFALQVDHAIELVTTFSSFRFPELSQPI
jgi:hypothetical protein